MWSFVSSQVINIHRTFLGIISDSSGVCLNILLFDASFAHVSTNVQQQQYLITWYIACIYEYIYMGTVCTRYLVWYTVDTIITWYLVPNTVLRSILLFGVDGLSERQK